MYIQVTTRPQHNGPFGLKNTTPKTGRQGGGGGGRRKAGARETQVTVAFSFRYTVPKKVKKILWYFIKCNCEKDVYNRKFSDFFSVVFSKIFRGISENLIVSLIICWSTSEFSEVLLRDVKILEPFPPPPP